VAPGKRYRMPAIRYACHDHHLGERFQQTRAETAVEALNTDEVVIAPVAMLQYPEAVLCTEL